MEICNFYEKKPMYIASDTPICPIIVNDLLILFDLA